MQVSAAKEAAVARPRALAAQATDAALIRSIADGDRTAMQIFYLRHHVKVHRFILRLTRDAGLAEDALSEVFLDVWRSAARFGGQCQVATWLLAIARNKAISKLRQRTWTSLKLAPLEEAAQIEDPAHGPEASLNDRDVVALLRQCMKELSPIHRQIVELVYFQSRSTREAAKIAGIPSSTVRSRMFNARSHLGRLLRQNGIEHAYA